MTEPTALDREPETDFIERCIQWTVDEYPCWEAKKQLDGVLSRLRDCERELAAMREGGVLVLRSRCHPEANGRKPVSGEQQWTLTFPLEDGRSLELKIGRKGRNLILGMLTAEEVDDERNTHC